ncbi:MAG: ABC transporter substrate-binding protein [Ilumatobacteraceae bacterium]
MPRSPSQQIAAVALAGLMIAVAACSSDTAAPPTSTGAPTTVPVARVDDGVLTIGVLKPQGSANADIGQAIGAAVQLAVNKINAAGGYNDRGVVLVTADEGVAGVGVDPAIATLLDAHVDAIIGPASSTNALAGLGEIVDAGVVSCSPTASASTLDKFPDHDLFFRTIPSDSLQALAIAEAVDRTGAGRATVTYIDDTYGQAFNATINASLLRKGIEPTQAVPYSADNESIRAAAGRVASLAAGVVVVIGDSTSGPVMLGAIDQGAGSLHPIYVVNDAMRRPTASAEPMGGSLASRVTGVSPIAFSTDAEFLAQVGATPDNPSPYAANAFDCVNLVALAALVGHSTQPEVIASLIPSISDGGSPCMSFAACRTDIEAGSNINYDGPGGTLTIGSDGDLVIGQFEVFGFDENGRDIDKGTIQVRA